MDGVKIEDNLMPNEKSGIPSFEISSTSIESENGIIFIPRPSTDPRDPLNWTFKKKATILAVLSIGLVAGTSAPFCGQLNLKQQATLYDKTVVQMTYTNSAAIAGFFSSGFFWWPLSHIYGRSSIIFWGQVGCLATQIWGPLMTSPNDYIPYILSRYFSGFFGYIPTILGPLYIVELFFLHQRGRVFTIFYLALHLGATLGPTFSGFVAAHGSWTLEYWWSISLLCVAAALSFCFLEETGFDRENISSNPIHSKIWIKNRIQTFFPGTRIVKPSSWGKVMNSVVLPFKIAISPVVLFTGMFICITFGFNTALIAFLPVWLQKSKKLGGYGFSVMENAEYSFFQWISLIFAIPYCQFVTDRLALWLTKRNHGVWQPEFRLYTLWIPSFILTPLGLTLVGVALQYRLNWIVLAVGSTMVNIGACITPGVVVNYVCECFRNHTTAASLSINSIRLILSICINFFITDWVDAVDVGWAYGMMAIFSVFAFGFLIVLMWKGHVIRGWTLFGLGLSEEGEYVVKVNRIG